MCCWIFLVPVLTAIFVIACTSESPRAGELQAFDRACDKANEGDWIAVEGYLRLPDILVPGCSVELRLFRDRTFRRTPIAATIPFGGSPDQAIKISSAYQDNDLKIHLADGTLVPFGTRVRVSGLMYYPMIPQDFECGLRDLYIQAAK
jgi:hypothetical protein